MAELIFKGTPQMETESLILRKINLDDARDMFEYASDEQVNRYLIWDRHATIDNSREFIRFTMGRYERDETGDWGIVWRQSGKLIGTVGFVWCDMNNHRAEIGYVLARPFWGQGIMPEAVGRIFQFGFTDMGLNRIECCHFLPNEKSGQVMQKVGMSFEGTARQKIFAKGQYWDVKQYAMLRSDFLGNS